MKEKISVIVPVYNVENYLPFCLDSICKQNYANLEIILVDDGSLDESGNICDQWVKKDYRIVVVHKENGGLSSARNTGLSYATGDYVSFIDSDDKIHPYFYEELLANIKKADADIAVCKFKRVEEIDVPFLPYRKSIIDTYVGEDKFKQLINENNVVTTIACNKLYKAKIWENFRFPEGKINEDEFVIHHILNRANRIVYLSEPFYYYLQRTGSITTKKTNNKNFDKLDAIKDRIYFFDNNKLSYYSNYFKFIYCYLNRMVYIQIDKNELEIKSMLNNEFFNYYSSIDNNLLSLKEKIKLFVLRYCLFLYYIKK